MSAIDERLAIRARLQAVEDDLVAAGKRNVTFTGNAGVFTWVLHGAGHEPVELLAFLDDIQEVEDMILAAGLDHLVEMTQHGTFTWARRTDGPHG